MLHILHAFVTSPFISPASHLHGVDTHTTHSPGIIYFAGSIPAHSSVPPQNSPSITFAHPYLCPPPNSPHQTELPSFPKSWLYNHGFFITTMTLLTPRSSLCPRPSARGSLLMLPHYHPSHAHPQYTHTHTHTPTSLCWPSLASPSSPFHAQTTTTTISPNRFLHSC